MCVVGVHNDGNRCRLNALKVHCEFLSIYYIQLNSLYIPKYSSSLYDYRRTVLYVLIIKLR